MSKAPLSPVHVAWSPGAVELVNLATGERGEGETLPELRSLWNGNKSVLVGVGRGSVFLKALRLPKAAPDDLRRILTVQLAQLFPIPGDQLSFDFLQTDDHNADGYLTIVGAMRSEDLRQLRMELQASGVSADRILPLSLASPIAAASAGATDALVIANDAEGLGLDVVQGGLVRFSRIVPRGSDPEIEAQRTVAAAKAGTLPMVSSGDVHLRNASSSRADNLTLLSEAPPFEFVLAEDREREVKQRVAARTRLAVLMMVSAILLLVLVLVDRHDAASQVQRANSAWTHQSSKLQAAAATQRSRLTAAQGVTDILNGAFKPAQPISDIAKVAGDSLPAGAWLNGITVSRGKALQLRGVAKTSSDVAQYVNVLGANPRFRNVQLVFASSGAISNVPIVQFNISATCVGNLPMPAPAKAATRARVAAPGGITP